MTAAAVFWFTGLSGAGKSTIACALKSRLELKGVSVLILDGDYVRKHLHKHLGFSDSDIKQNNLLIAKLCINNRNKYEVILVPIISPFKSSRQLARNMLGNKFYEVYLSVDLDTVVERDVKGLYAKAIDGEIDNLIGFSPGSVYQAPLNADCILDTGCETETQSLEKLYTFVVKCLSPNELQI